MKAALAPKKKNRKARRGPRIQLLPVAAADGVARVAGRRSARAAIGKRGLVKRVRSLAAAGHNTASAAEVVAQQGKGYVAEAQLAASYSARAGLVGSSARAHPNHDAFHPTDDIILTEAGKRAGAIQVKDGLPDYVLRHHESGKYPSIVANREAVEHLEQVGAIAGGQIPSYIEHSGVRSTDFTAKATHMEAKGLLVSALEESPHHEHVMALASAARSGAADGAVTFGLSLAAQAVEDMLAGKPLEFLPMVGEAAKAGAKAFVRTTAVTFSQSMTLLRRAGIKIRLAMTTFKQWTKLI